MDQNLEILDTPSIINNEFDFSNSIPTIEWISYLAEYCDGVYKEFKLLMETDKKKNEPFKEEYKNYEYKTRYSDRFEIYIRLKSYNNISCKDFESFKTAIRNGNLSNIDSMDIKLNLDYKRGKGNNLVDHENSFSIMIKPYHLVFARKSTHNELNMNQIEKNINQILSKFPTVNTIFCTKE